MIHLQVITSSDPLAIGQYNYQFDSVHIGRSKKNDLIFLDKDLPLYFLKLEIINSGHQNELVIRNYNRIPFFYVNGKKISGVLKIKSNDVIAFGDNKIKILQFNLNPQSDDLATLYSKFDEESPELRFILDVIEDQLIALESQE
jgi:hypothetical protein